jgi:uncharacterized membrane protein
MVYQVAATFHLIAAVSALGLGMGVIFTRKGTRLHKQLGYAYFFNMLGLNISALFIYRLTGRFGPFHIAALASLITLFAGFIPAYLRLPNVRWLELHYQFMNWSYAGLVAAGVSEAATRLPSAPFWPAVFIGTLLVFLIGGVLIAHYRSKYRFERMTKQSNPSKGIGTFVKRRRDACS